jgi:hypothetical protein
VDAEGTARLKTSTTHASSSSMVDSLMDMEEIRDMEDPVDIGGGAYGPPYSSSQPQYSPREYDPYGAPPLPQLPDYLSSGPRPCVVPREYRN